MAQESNPVSRDPAPDAQPTATATTAEIREQIDQTRAEMGQTIDAIHARLSPGRLVSDAKDSVKEATVGRVRRLATATHDTFGNGRRASFGAKRVVDAVKANPMPFAMVGTAAMALIARAAMRSRHRAHRGSGHRHQFWIGACAAGVAGWSAWRQRQAIAREATHRGLRGR
jgi:Protein of unknown function (DUF3618)